MLPLWLSFFFNCSQVLPIKIASSCILAAWVISWWRIEVINQFSWSWRDIRKQGHGVVGELVTKVWINWWKVCYSVIHSSRVAICIEGATYVVLLMVPTLFSPSRVSMYGWTTNPILRSSMFVSEDFIDRSEYTISFSTRAYRRAWVTSNSKSVRISA